MASARSAAPAAAAPPSTAAVRCAARNALASQSRWLALRLAREEALRLRHRSTHSRAACEAAAGMSDDPVDVKAEIEEACKPQCTKALAAYAACAERIQKDKSGEAHCTGQYFDLYECIDKCAAPKIFAKLR